MRSLWRYKVMLLEHWCTMAKTRKGKKEASSWSKEHSLVMESSYATPAITIIRGSGCYLVDVDGKRYLDFLGGIATNALGAAHPDLIGAVTRQMKRVSHLSNFYANPESLKLARELQLMVGDDQARIFFSNSGAEANEAAIKISRLTGRTRLVATTGSFHGRTMGALSLTGQDKKQRPFRPLLKDVKFVPYGDLKAMKRAITKRTAMVIVEPIQGENGVIVAPVGYLKGIQERCAETGTLFAVDAIQTGVGRCGSWFGWDEEIAPDLITIAKGIGGGLPLAATIIRGRSPHFSPGEHGSTFGGNPVAAAAANQVLATIKKKNLMKHVLEMGSLIKAEAAKVEGVLDVRGRGLLLGIVLERSFAKEIVLDLADRGVLANATSENVIRIAPPLIIGKREVSTFTKALAESLNMRMRAS